MPAKKRRRIGRQKKEEEQTPLSPSKQNPITTSINGHIDKHESFATWARSRGVKIHGVRADAIADRGIGLITSRKVRAGEKLVFVPEQAMLKPLPHHLKNAGLSPQAKLTATLLELCASERDDFSRCRAVWPAYTDFASSLWWYTHPSDIREWESKLPRSLCQARSRLMHDFLSDRESILALGVDTVAHPDFTYLWTIANTRSFSFKPTGSKEGAMVMCPFLDYMNHCPAEEGCEVKVDQSGYSLYADRDYGIGDEILATYGAHSNDKLLVHYGFSVPGSNDDSISLDEIILPSMSEQQRQDLQNMGFLGHYSFTPSTRELCFRTHVALRSMLTTSNEWEFFLNSGEDIGDDKGDEVQHLLTKMIREWLCTAVKDVDAVALVRKAVTDPLEASAIGLCADRARYIVQRLREYAKLDSDQM